MAALSAIVERVRATAAGPGDARLVAELAAAMRCTESRIGGAAAELAARITRALGRGRPLTYIGDRVATPLQQPGLS